MFDSHGTAEEALLDGGAVLEDALRYARARVAVDIEEEASALSVRPTMPVFQGEPWR